MPFFETPTGASPSPAYLVRSSYLGRIDSFVMQSDVQIPRLQAGSSSATSWTPTNARCAARRASALAAITSGAPIFRRVVRIEPEQGMPAQHAYVDLWWLSVACGF